MKAAAKKARSAATPERRKRNYFGDETPVLFGSVGVDGRLKTVNSAWARVLGYDHDELRNRPLYELMPLRLHAAVTVVKQLLDASKLGPMECLLRCKDGTHKRFVWHRRFDPEPQRMFIAGEEVSEPGRTKP